MDQIDGEALMFASLDAQMLYIRHKRVFLRANRTIRGTVHDLRCYGQSPLNHQTMIAQGYMDAIRDSNESVADALEQDLDTLAKVVGRTCLISFFDETIDEHLSVLGDDIYRSFSMRVIRSGLEPSIPVYLSHGYGLSPYIEAATSEIDRVNVIPGVKYMPAPEVGQLSVSFPWSVIDQIEIQG